jgi:COMPASS component SWD3
LTTKYQNTLEGHTNRVFSLKFDPMNPNILYSGSWDFYILANDLRTREKVGDIFGTYVCGESIDVRGS